MIQDKAILVTLEIGLWSAKKKDSSVTREVDEAHDATDSGVFQKFLLKKDRTKNIINIMGRARVYNYYHTLPWAARGVRILPIKNYFEYCKGIDILKKEFDKAVEEFCASFEDFVEERKGDLGSLFDPSDYPKRASIKHKFYFDVTFMPVPVQGDFRIEINQEEREKMEEQLIEKVKQAEEEGLKELWNRLYVEINHIFEKLKDPKGIFRNTITDNLGNLLDILPKLNVTNDPELDTLVQDAKILLVDPTMLREDFKKRKETADQAREILRKMGMSC